jgi:hypothetical protein
MDAKADAASEQNAARQSLSTAESMADLLKQIRDERQEVLQLHRESRKRINRGSRAAISQSSGKLPALWYEGRGGFFGGVRRIGDCSFCCVI